MTASLPIAGRGKKWMERKINNQMVMNRLLFMRTRRIPVPQNYRFPHYLTSGPILRKRRLNCKRYLWGGMKLLCVNGVKDAKGGQMKRVDGVFLVLQPILVDDRPAFRPGENFLKQPVVQTVP